ELFWPSRSFRRSCTRCWKPNWSATPPPSPNPAVRCEARIDGRRTALIRLNSRLPPADKTFGCPPSISPSRAVHSAMRARHRLGLPTGPVAVALAGGRQPHLQSWTITLSRHEELSPGAVVRDSHPPRFRQHHSPG